MEVKSMDDQYARDLRFLLLSHYGLLKLAMPQGFPTVLRPCSTLTHQFSGATSFTAEKSLQKEGE
jgi:hypothetical protein